MDSSRFQVVRLSLAPHLLSKVIELGDSQRATLGFFPEAAFQDYARKDHVLIAIDSSESLLGYIAFRITRKNKCYLTHVCVAPECRKVGIAKALLDQIKKETKHLFGIVLKCRRDYGIDSFWQRNGFSPINEIDGRAMSGSKLTVWEYLHHPTLLSLPPVGTVPLAILDINIVIGAFIEDDAECRVVFDGVSADEVEFRVSDFSLAEVNRCENEQIRQKSRQAIRKFSTIPLCSSRELVLKVGDIIGAENPDSQQIASAIHAGADCFVTKDNALRRRAESIYKQFGLQVYSPTGFVVNMGSDLNDKLYSPGFTPFSDIELKPVKLFDENILFSEYAHPSEKKNGISAGANN